MERNGINECIQSEVIPRISREYKTLNELYSDVIDTKEVIVLGVFGGRQLSDYIQDEFFSAAHSLADSVLFRHIYTDSMPNVYDFELFKSLKDYSLPYILLIRPKHLWNKYETKFVVHSFGDIIDFIKNNFYGLVGLRTSTVFDSFEFPIINIYSDIDYENESKNTIDLRNKILELSLNNKDIKFIISDANIFIDELKTNYGFKSKQQILDSVPIVTTQDINHKRFLFNEKRFSIESLKKFLVDLRQVKLDSVFESEEQLLSTSLVKEVSAQGFQEVVLNSKKESFIMFYTKDCDYCKSLDKTLQKIGKALENEPNIQIIRQEFNGDYFADQFKAEDFPTFYWFDKNKQIVLYYGRHHFSDIIAFIAENSNQELKDYNRLGHLKNVKQEL